MGLAERLRSWLPWQSSVRRPKRLVGFAKPRLEPLEAREVLDSGTATLDPAGFITGLFENVLHRSPAANELTAWEGKLNEGLSQTQLTAMFTQDAYINMLRNAEPPVALTSVLPAPGADATGSLASVVGSSSSATPSIADPPLAAASNAWTAIGPASLNNGQVPGNGPVSGRVVGIAADPNNANIIYLAAAGGGVWKTTNGGTTWTPLTDNQATLFMGAIAVAPSNSQVIYAGTGESNNSGDSYYGRGILKSTDGGTTWTLETAGGAFDRRAFSKIVIDPTNANIAYAAVTDNAVNGLSGNTGIWKTTDGGATWTDTTTGIPNITTTNAFTDVVIDPTNSQHLFCAVGDFTGSAVNGVYTTSNGGTTWTAAGNFAIGATNGLIKLAIAPSNDNVVYATVADPTTFGIAYITKTTDGGVTWNHVTTPINYLGDQGYYDSTVAVDPTNANIVYVGGSFNGISGNNFINQVLRSADGGTTWADITVGTSGTNGLHADHHAMTFDANGKLLDGNDGGIWRLDSGTPGNISWTDLNGNLGTIQFYGIALNPANASIAYGGSQDNGTSKFTGSPAWQQVVGGDGGFVRVDFTNPNTFYHTFFRVQGNTQFIERSDDAGATFTDISAGINPNDPSEFIVPYVMDPSNSSRLILGTDHVYETTNQGNNWTAIGTPGTNGFNPNDDTVTALAVAKTNSQTIYAAAGGHIFVTTNDGATWQQRDIPGVSDNIQDLEVDPTTSTTVYAVRDRFGGGKVFRSTDGGVTWSNISSNLPDLPAYSLAIDTRDSALFVGNDTGVFVSTNQGQTWSTMGTGLSHAQADDLEFNAGLNLLAAGTHGRSMWEISVPASTPVVPKGTVTSDLRIFFPLRYTFDAHTNTLDGNLTLVNNLSNSLAVPHLLVVAFPNLPTGVTLANATGQLAISAGNTVSLVPLGTSATDPPAISLPLTSLPPGIPLRVRIQLRASGEAVPSTFFLGFPVEVFAI